ncbi:hypothetical protein RF11_04872 [Thelohanellus kitauei]|uniref:PDZ domain-containing protein n=1 Tax=Thelohanellus kitauei TaxID=669202 RepID=A0A0C2JQL1_THEKT|nr:hypothetical protein RF11_04872 [Thelohanellus kitauei]
MNEARRISEAGQINSGHIDRETNENLKIVDISNNNILHHVVRKGLANHLAAIIKHLSKLSKSEVIRLFSAKNSSGNTPVHICVLQTNKTCLLMLSRLKICHLVTNSTGDCALDLAIKICDTDLVNILKNVNNFSNMEISDVRSKTLTYRQSLQHCLTYANTLRCRRSGDRIFRPYPPILKVSKSFTFKEFEITEGDCVFVYIVLMTKVAYGYKVLSENRIFAWFPSECVGLSSRRQISEWQKEHASLSNLIINIPELPTLNQTGGLPLMLFLNLGLKETNVGLEIGQRKLKEQDLAIPSPFYVRNVVIDSPADVCGLRVGDSIIYIMSNEITSFSLRIVKTIFKKMLRSKPPADLPTTTIRQICLMILRQNDPIFLSDDHDDVMSEYFTLNNNSPIETLGSLSYDINPKFFLNSTFDGQTMKRNRRESYNKPLPEIPSSAKNNNLEVPQNENTECSTSLSSISNLPPPSCDMDED